MMRTGVGLLVLGLAIGLSVPTCQGQIFFSTDEQSAKVIALQGQVSVLKDTVPWALQVGDWVRMKQEIVTGADGFAAFQVSDGSTFEVFPNSRVTFRNNPSNLKDLVDVWLGKIKVEIQRLSGQPNHNRIHTPTAVISVRGTVFYVEIENEGDTTLVLVEHGEVAVQHALLPRGEAKVLTEGEWIRVNRAEPLARQSVDKESVLRFAMRALSEALYTAMTYGGQGSGGQTSGGGGRPLPGDRGPGTGSGQPGESAPAPPPPPPPPPPSN